MDLDHIIQALERIEKNLQTILEKLEPGKSISTFNEQDWAQQEKVLSILGISLRTLYRLRKDGRIDCKKNGSRAYYFLPDIFKIRNKFLK